MKISLNTIRKVNQIYNTAGDPAPDGVDALVEKIGAQLGAVEEVIDFGKQFEEVVIVKVVECQKHSDADKLSLCKVDDGKKIEEIERDDNGHIQVVCGADNVKAGMLAAWLPPGATVPNTLDKDPFVLESRKIRGKTSHGMLASAQELGIGSDHDGIVEIDKEVEPGTPFIEAYDLVDEAVIDIENKMFTHRPDCFGFLGVAREIEGIHGRSYKSPKWYTANPQVPEIEADELPLEVNNHIPELVPRFTAISIRDVEVKPSPLWLQIFLTSVGIKPVNNIVDYTNYFMMETGQPIHAYDYDKVAQFSHGDGAVIDVRNPKSNEKIIILGGKTIEPHPEAMMVAAGDNLICIGGTIGGVNSEVGDKTKNIIIEAATWDMYAIRKTAMKHGIYTDAVTRFTKGQSPLQNKAVILKIANEIQKYASGKIASSLVDVVNIDQKVVSRNSLHPSVETDSGFINSRLGVDLSAEQMAKLLTNVEFEVVQEANNLRVKAPFWRTDIEIPEDIVEEVGRLHGFDKVKVELPSRSIAPVSRNSNLELKSKIRRKLAATGANEVLTYSFVNQSLLDKTTQDKSRAYKIANALSPDLQLYRLSLLPSLLDKVHMNQKAGYSQLCLFELGKNHQKGYLEDNGLPLETESLALVYSSTDKTDSGPAYYQAKLQLENLLDKISNQLSFVSLAGNMSDSEDMPEWLKPFEPARSAIVMRAGEAIGAVGEFKASTRQSLKLSEKTAGFEIGLAYIADAIDAFSYLPLSRFPAVEQDISLKIPVSVNYENLEDVIKGAIDKAKPEDTMFELKPLDIFQRGDDKDHKQIAFRLNIKSLVRTLKAEEVNSLLDKAAESAAEELQATRL